MLFTCLQEQMKCIYEKIMLGCHGPLADVYYTKHKTNIAKLFVRVCMLFHYHVAWYKAQDQFIAFGGVWGYEECPKCLYAPHLKSSPSREEDERDEVEDVIDAMLNRGRRMTMTIPDDHDHDHDDNDDDYDDHYHYHDEGFPKQRWGWQRGGCHWCDAK